MRLDVYLVQVLNFESRHKAQIEIKHNRIKVNGQVINKPSYTVTEDDVVEVLSAFNRFVGKGGLKLAYALDQFGMDVKDLHVLDVGASTGGFTDCLLQRGAKAVRTIDVGQHQLHDDLKADQRVEVFERKNFLSVDAGFFTGIDLTVMDVSFTSCVPLIEHLFRFLDKPLMVLFKPQFESLETPRSGVIKHRRIHERTLKRFADKVHAMGLALVKIVPSPIVGGSGNIEFLCLLEKGHKNCDFEGAIGEAYKAF